MLKDSLIRQPTEEDPDEGIKDIVEITLKKMVLLCVLKLTCNILPLFTKYINLIFRIMTMMGKCLILILRRQSKMKTFYLKLLATASQMQRAYWLLSNMHSRNNMDTEKNHSFLWGKKIK